MQSRTGLSLAEALRAPNRWIAHAHDHLVTGTGPLVDMRARLIVVEKRGGAKVDEYGHTTGGEIIDLHQLGEVGGIWDRYKHEYRTEEKGPPPATWRLHKHQAKVWETIHDILDPTRPIPIQELIVIGGRRGGKSHVAVDLARSLALALPGSVGEVWGYNFTDNLEGSGQIISKFWQGIPDDWITHYSPKERAIYWANGSVVKFKSANKPKSARSGAPHWAVLDEPSHYDSPGAVIDALIFAMVENAAPIIMITSPLGYDRVYFEAQKALDPDPEVSQGIKVVHLGATFDNPFISDKAIRYLMSLKKHMSRAQYDQEVLGKHVNISGLVFYDYTEKNEAPEEDLDPQLDITAPFLGEYMGRPEAEIILGMDFNMNPISAAAARLYAGGVLHYFKEFEMNDANTSRFGIYLLDPWLAELYPDLSREERLRKLLIVGDASGQWQEFGKSKDGAKEIPAFRQLRALGYDVIAPQRTRHKGGGAGKRKKRQAVYSANPERGRRMEAARARVLTLENEIKILVDPECRQITKMFRSLTLYNSLPDLHHELIHMYDAVTYPIHRIFPMLDLGSISFTEKRDQPWVYEIIDRLSAAASSELGT